jgi:hypothetical protein
MNSLSCITVDPGCGKTVQGISRPNSGDLQLGAAKVAPVPMLTGVGSSPTRESSASRPNGMGVASALTCFSHREKGGVVFQKREPDGEWYVFKTTAASTRDEYGKVGLATM